MAPDPGDSQLFDDALLADVAAEYALEEPVLSSLVTDHQRLVQRSPGVENLVYEWRRGFDASLLGRTERAYYVLVPATVWDEFGDALGTGGPELDAVRAVHRRTVSGRTDAPREPDDGWAYVALDRRGTSQ